MSAIFMSCQVRQSNDKIRFSYKNKVDGSFRERERMYQRYDGILLKEEEIKIQISWLHVFSIIIVIFSL